ncbi:putative periplasmic lipoprotein [Psychrobacter lutiphocae]|uniref:hypothetical protein n=1 Tax=Psychrobacter lutiphocae TaxID=540500 RepID=UPI00036881FD|nr:hypothetical protein [Psychrobacter lutiphocae]
MKSLLVSAIILISLSGCAASNQPTMPKGKWHLINQKGFVPANVERFTDGVDVFIPEAEAEAEVDQEKQESSDVV